jgi:hypothetical protein
MYCIRESTFPDLGHTYGKAAINVLGGHLAATKPNRVEDVQTQDSVDERHVGRSCLRLFQPIQGVIARSSHEENGTDAFKLHLYLFK